MLRRLAMVCILLAILATGIGGLIDIQGKKRIGPITKKHMWNDGHFLVLLAIALLLLDGSGK
jgi:hypothetical protein